MPRSLPGQTTRSPRPSEKSVRYLRPLSFANFGKRSSDKKRRQHNTLKMKTVKSSRKALEKSVVTKAKFVSFDVHTGSPWGTYDHQLVWSPCLVQRSWFCRRSVRVLAVQYGVRLEINLSIDETNGADTGTLALRRHSLLYTCLKRSQVAFTSCQLCLIMLMCMYAYLQLSIRQASDYKYAAWKAEVPPQRS